MTTSDKYRRLFELLNEVARDLVQPQRFKEIKALSKTKKHLAGIQQEELIGSILDEAFNREPEVFHEIKWVNTSLGTPLWVRPGETWVSDTEAPEAETLTSLLESAGAELISVNRRPLTNADVVSRLLKSQQEETEDEMELFINYWAP